MTSRICTLNAAVKLEEALTLIKKAVELDPQNGAFLDSLGWVYFKLGQYGPAEESLRKAIERTAGDASIHDHLAEVYEKTGRLETSRCPVGTHYD